MAIESILSQIDADIARLTEARSLLAKSSGNIYLLKGNGKAATATRKKHVLSPEARKRIADAQRRRWAAQRAKNK